MFAYVAGRCLPWYGGVAVLLYVDVGNEIGNEGAEALATNLVKNTTLTTLTVEGIWWWRSLCAA